LINTDLTYYQTVNSYGFSFINRRGIAYQTPSRSKYNCMIVKPAGSIKV